MNEYDSYQFDISAQPLMRWLERRLKRGQRDAIDNLAKRMIDDRRIPRTGSLSMYRVHLASKNYSQQDLQVFEQAWEQFRNEQLGEE